MASWIATRRWKYSYEDMVNRKTWSQSMKYMMALFFLLNTLTLDAQSISVEFSSKFEQPFRFSAKWDLNEGSPSGPGGILFLENSIIIPNNNTGEWYIYSFKIKELQRSQYKGYRVLIRPIDILSFGSRWAQSVIYLNSQDESKESLIIDFSGLQGKERLDGTPLYLTGNMLFAQVGNKKLASWELLPDGKTFYRDSKQTEIWLNANGQKVGYHLSPYGNIYFTTFMSI